MARKIKGALLPTLGVNRPVTAVMALLCTLVVGFIAYGKIPLQILPSGFESPYLGVRSSFGSSGSPYEVESQITRPLEEMLRTVPGIERIRSRCRSWDTDIYLEFDQRTDMKLAYSQVRDRIERTMPLLPPMVRKVDVRKYDETTDIPILYFSFNTLSTLEDPFYFAETQIKRRLERIDGVANVQFWGAQEKRVNIDLDREKLRAMNVDLYGLTDQLRRDNFALSSGYLEEGGIRHLVRSAAHFTSLEQIGNLPIGNERGLRLGDVARVSYSPRMEMSVLRRDGEPTMQMAVWKESLANTVEVSQKVERVLKDEIPAQAGLGWLNFQVYFNSGRHILEAIGNIKQTCFWGGVFAVLILLFFLRSRRMTAIITMAIPLSLLVTLIVMYFLGWSLDLITMMGMMISIGMVVDNSIVVVENIFRLRQEGLDYERAAVEGASEVSLAITLSTLTTVVVFLPLMLLGEDKDFTFYMIRIGVPVIVALVASLIVALYLIPLGTVRISSRKTEKERRSITWCNDRYQQVLRWTLAHRLDAAIILIALLASSAIPLGKIKKFDYSENERDRIDIVLEPPNYFSWDMSQAAYDKIEKFLDRRRERYGLKSVTLRGWLQWGQFELFRPIENRQWYEIAYRKIRKSLRIPVDSALSYTELIQELNDSLPKFPDVPMMINWNSDTEKDPSINLILYGDDSATLVEIGREIRRRLAAVKGLTGLDIELEKGQDEVNVSVDRQVARQYGLDARRIASTVAYSGSEVRLSEFRSSEKEIQMYLRFADADSFTVEKLASQPVHTASGQQVPLGTLANFTVQKGQGTIERENGKTYIRIRASAGKDDKEKIFARVDEIMAGIDLPSGYSWNKGDQLLRRQQQVRSQYFGIIAGIIFVFLIMGLLFESFVLPLCVLIAIPFSFCGSYWALYLTDTSLEILAMIGLIIMIGVVVNNAIVLVDTIRLYRDRGMERTEALLEAGRHRFRPILMTAATTIGGLVPMAVGGAKMIDLSYAPMGRTMIGGMVTSTLITLVAVPLLYTFFDDLRGFGARIT
ncbi:MAG: efflux RND transporter permease subunit, partial [Candidatus Glassbacteria bacterium]